MRHLAKLRADRPNRFRDIKANAVLELRGASGGLAPLVQALPQTPIIGLRSALAIRPPENFLIIRLLGQCASSSKISCPLVGPFRRYGHFPTFWILSWKFLLPDRFDVQFKSSKFYLLSRFKKLMYVIMPNFAQIGHTVAYGYFSIFQDGGCSLYWICFTRVQPFTNSIWWSLVVIGAVISIVCIGIVWWNLLDQQTVDAPSINTFKSRLYYIRDNRMDNRMRQMTENPYFGSVNRHFQPQRKKY